MTEPRNAPVCPRCGARDSIPIVYGMPGMELMEQARAGQVVLGGCVVFEDQPDRRCRSCDSDWLEGTTDAS